MGVLGQGAMGVVYRAHDPVINRPVAIKTIQKSLIGSDPSGASASARFRNEAQAVGRLSHPGIVQIYEYGEDDSVAFIAMEFVRGRTLSQILEGTPRLPEPDVLRIMDQLLAALECAHDAGVWHRDIKPANLLITDSGQLKVTDFGIARIDTVALTQVTSTIGTPGYMSPEQYVGSSIDHRVDLFAAGVLLYRLLTGGQPFSGTAESVMYQILNVQALPPSQVPAAFRPAFYDAIVAKAMAKDRDARYAKAAHFRAALANRLPDIPPEEAQTTLIVGVHTSPAETSVAGVAGPAIGLGAGSGSGSRSGGSGSGNSTALPTGWDANTLTRVEQALASFVGPMAKVMVRQAAKSCLDLATLTTALGQHLGNDRDRVNFQAKLAGTAVTPAKSLFGFGTKSAAPAIAPAVAPMTQTALAPHSQPLSPEITAVGLKALTSQIGPIASVMVKKAAAKARTQEQFFQILADSVPEGADRDRFLRDVRGGKG